MITNINAVSKSLLYLLITHNIVTADDQWWSESFKNEHNWDGQFFPYAPGTAQNPNPSMTLAEDLYNSPHRVPMGIENPDCDDGKINLQVDWDFNPVNHTCFEFNDKHLYKPRSEIRPLYVQEHIPKGYVADHKCMDQAIEYEEVIPTFGTHRPLWAKYGEYTFLPRQRWLHNLEHGSVVMLYHPCTDKNEINILRSLVTKCLYRHIITPYNLLSSKRPLALVTWGHRLEMSKVAPEIVIDFIKKHALRGPEQTHRDGQYDNLLEKHAEIVTDIDDHQLCKLHDYMQ